MNKTFRTEYLSDVIDIIDDPETTSIVCHGKQFDLVKHGHWIFNPKDAIEMMFTLPICSECGAESSDGGNYCHNCGTRMDGAEK